MEKFKFEIVKSQEQTHEEIPIDFHPLWIEVLKLIKEQFHKKPDLESILFLIGIQELQNTQSVFSKEQKQDLMHIATCKLLSLDGYYKFIDYDADGWPVYEIEKRLPIFSAIEQEAYLKKNVIRYFQEAHLI